MKPISAEKELGERVELSLLYDFYGALLKESQRKMFEANILEDLTFTEIAEEEGISRQGVYDAIKRASKQLRFYEEKLGLVAKFGWQKKLARELGRKLEGMVQPEEKEKWGEIMLLLEKILEA